MFFQKNVDNAFYLCYTILVAKERGIMNETIKIHTSNFEHELECVYSTGHGYTIRELFITIDGAESNPSDDASFDTLDELEDYLLDKLKAWVKLGESED